MSKITEPMLLDKTGQQFLGLMEKQNELLTAIASGYNYKPTSIADVFAVVQSGNASQVFNYGDQIILPWTDKATGKTYECPLDVVHFGDVTLADGETVPGMLVQWHYATPFGVQFNQFQAFKYCEEQLPAGTYNVIIGDTWGNNCVKGKTYQFTLTKPVPAKGQLAGLYRAPDVSPSEWKVYSFESNTATDPIETVAMVEGTGGTALGTLSFKPTSPLNGLQSTAYGYNRWAQSAMRQWLNSEEANGKWWTPQHNFDRTPDQLKEKHGFLTGFDEEFTKRLKATKVSTWKNTLTDNGDTDGIEVTYDKVFLPSLEAMSINPQKAGEDDVWEYWKRASGMAEKMQQYKTYPQIRTFAIENHTSPQGVRLRSAHRGNSHYAWCVNSDGNVYYSTARWAARCAPACWLC